MITKRPHSARGDPLLQHQKQNTTRIARMLRTTRRSQRPAFGAQHSAIGNRQSANATPKTKTKHDTDYTDVTDHTTESKTRIRRSALSIRRSAVRHCNTKAKRDTDWIAVLRTFRPSALFRSPSTEAVAIAIRKAELDDASIGLEHLIRSCFCDRSAPGYALKFRLIFAVTDVLLRCYFRRDSRKPAILEQKTSASTNLRC